MNATRRCAIALVFAALSAASLSCGKKAAQAPPTGLALLGGADCDPLVPSHCGFPFPSNVWRGLDPATQQFQLQFGKTTLPVLKGTRFTDRTLWQSRDGFAVAQALLTQLPGAVADGLPDENHLADSIAATSPTVLMNADTGALVPHIAELDAWAMNDGERTFMIRPLQRLDDGQRYLVAIRHVKGASGSAVAPSPAFLALRDKGSSTEPSVGLRRDLYEDIFTRLAAHGVARAELQLAWDFTTASRANTTQSLLAMRDKALAAVGADGPTYVIKQIELNPNGHIAKRIHGTMTVPYFLTDTTESGRLVFGPDGLPQQNGTASFDFLVHVPNSCNAAAVCGVVQNGHGLLGSKEEGQDGYLAQFADDFHYVAIAIDWWGFATGDFGTVFSSVVDDVAAFPRLVEHQQQGMVNALLLMRMMKGRFAQDANVQVGGASVYDPKLLFYRGDSQGGIFGATYMSISTDVTRGLLGEPGMPYNLLLDRSVDFTSYRALLHSSLPDARDAELYLDLIQQFWDRVEPIGYAAHLATDPLPGTPAHRVLLHAAIGDHQVTTLGAHLLARTIGAPNLSPVNRTVYGVAQAPGPFTEGSALIEFSYGLPAVPTQNLPPSGAQYGDDPHGAVRSEPAAQKMADAFFRTGVIAQTCQGSCDPE